MCIRDSISTVHSDYRLDYLGRPFARAVYGTLNTWALHRLDYRVCVSDPIRQRLIDRGFEPNRLFSIYNGLDFSHVVPKTDRAAYFAQFGYTVHEDDIIVGIAARLDPVKDIPTLLRAVALAQKACPQLRLAIAGDGMERKKLEALARELEITDLNRIYLEDGSLNVELLGQGFTWLDTGTHESLVEATNFVKTIESHQHRKIACLEEIAYLSGWITREDVLKAYEPLKKNQYGQYLMDVLDGKYMDVLH